MAKVEKWWLRIESRWKMNRWMRDGDGARVKAVGGGADLVVVGSEERPAGELGTVG